MFDENYKNLIIADVKKNGTHVLRKYDEAILDDFDLMCQLAEDNFTTLDYVSDRLKNDRDFILFCIKHGSAALHYAPMEYRKNKEIVLMAVKLNGNALEYASEELKDDEEIVLAAIKNSPMALEYASERLSDNYFIVERAVEADGEAIKFASERLRNIYYLVNKAIRNNSNAFEYISEELQDDIRVVINARLKENNENLYFTNYSQVLKFASERLKNNKVLKYANDNILKSMLMVCNDYKNLSRLPKCFFKEENKSFLELAIDIIKDSLKKLPITKENKAYCKEVARFVKEVIAQKKLEIENDNEVKREKDRNRKAFEDEIDEMFE